MTTWDEVVGAVLLGTRRRGVDLTGLPDGVRALAESRGTAAEQALVAAAVITGYRRAGRRALADVRPAEPAAPDGRPFLPSRARERLVRLLSANRPELLEEWLHAVAARKLRVPAERLPALADAARVRVSLRAPLAEVAGAAGAWLGRHNPDWAFLIATGDDTTDAWQFGTAAQRQAWLARTLRTEPDRAREALAGTWHTEPADLRATFLTMLGEHLAERDEQFLETARADRAAGVRDIALRLSGRFPRSAFGERMAARLRACVTVRTRALRADILEFTPPAPDDALARDGIRVPPGPGQGAARLRAVIAATPLRFWVPFGTPGELAGMLVAGVPLNVVRESWATAALRQRDESWAQALVEAEPSGRGTAELVGVLSPARQAAAVAKLARGLPIETLTRLILDLPRPWPAPLGQVLLDWVAEQPDHRLVAHAAALVAQAVPPECLGHPLADVPPPGEAAPWRRAVAETLTFRREMHEELS
ncbi:DUF5691 domain-containing protein [Amycolatopsis jiangsuensis]|uniref:Uncharacterized protein n=1 Tax=Amycolatopsis jiangsuensis TaxID=1181879 RepID=A0A840IPE4_9PSEU|nr:DUF5691 domain-containing protein [Amycolatopsis jiangsuensis]MBB4683058.1 hypothetical protein [Amycolatopsis jiangsuensis]